MDRDIQAEAENQQPKHTGAVGEFLAQVYGHIKDHLSGANESNHMTLNGDGSGTLDVTTGRWAHNLSPSAENQLMLENARSHGWSEDSPDVNKLLQNARIHGWPTDSNQDLNRVRE